LIVLPSLFRVSIAPRQRSSAFALEIL
jgi:hypothetical protein